MKKYLRFLPVCFVLALAACQKEAPPPPAVAAPKAAPAVQEASAPASAPAPGQPASGISEWIKITDLPDNVGTAYYDKSSIRRAGDIASLSRLVDFKSNQSRGAKGEDDGKGDVFRSQKYQDEIDCGKSQIRTVKVTDFSESMARGKVGREFGVPGNWQPLSADSMFMRVACAKN